MKVDRLGYDKLFIQLTKNIKEEFGGSMDMYYDDCGGIDECCVIKIFNRKDAPKGQCSVRGVLVKYFRSGHFIDSLLDCASFMDACEHHPSDFELREQ